MKYVMLLGVLALGFASCTKDHRCMAKKDQANCICTMEYNPVCGCDEVTYSNACHAECSGIEDYTPGALKTLNN